MSQLLQRAGGAVSEIGDQRPAVLDTGDLDDRRLWHEYQRAYGDALTNCNTAWAPWYVVPADRKWYRNLVVSEILLEVMESMDPKFPEAVADPMGQLAAPEAAVLSSG